MKHETKKVGKIIFSSNIDPAKAFTSVIIVDSGIIRVGHYKAYKVFKFFLQFYQMRELYISVFLGSGSCFFSPKPSLEFAS